ncbi:hypothetical protein GDO81_024711 [Engystomops pustulosus]|uniref:Uncharacterized protein n=1 Tax=Engystomops pustulosus TaxID=76066 RepID=A0AAV6YIF6_ENGPU|nr:hypothetical protein GDO81_024711 [Engystomops pustulosus]
MCQKQCMKNSNQNSYIRTAYLQICQWIYCLKKVRVTGQNASQQSILCFLFFNNKYPLIVKYRESGSSLSARIHVIVETSGCYLHLKYHPR